MEQQGDGNEPARARSGRTAYLLIGLVLLLVLGAGVRFYGLRFGLPLKLARPDEQRIAAASNFMLKGNTLRPLTLRYPSLYIYLATLPRWIALRQQELSEEDRARFFTHPEHYLFMRSVSAALGTLTILLVFFLGGIACSTRVGVGAAFLLALTHLHVRDSHFGVTDTAVTFFVALALILILRLGSTGSWRATLLAGFLSGLAFSTKYPALFLLLPLGLALCSAHPPHRAFKAFSSRLIAACAFFLIAFILTTPYALLDLKRFLADLFFEGGDKTEGYSPAFSDRGWVQHARLTFWHGLGFPYLLTSLAGMILALYKRSRHLFLLVTFVAAYYVFMGIGTKIYARYMLPLLPVLAVTAAFALNGLAEALRPARSTSIFVLLLMAAVSLSAMSVYHSDRLLAAEDTRVEAARFLDGMVAEDEKCLMVGRFTLPAAAICRPPRFEKIKGKDLDLRIAEAGSIHDALAGKYDYLVWGSYFFSTQFSSQPATLEQLKRRFTPVRSFSPLKDGLAAEDVHPVFNDQDKIYLPYAGFKGFEQPGPFIHVVRVEKR